MNNEKKKQSQAIALEYDPSDIAPRVIATGKGELADRIVNEAIKDKIPIHKDEKLAKTLSYLDVGDAIPPELYEIVAEILVFVDAMDKLKGQK